MLRVAEQAYRTDTGRQRQANEDALFARSPLFAVADGMGGAQAGEVASQIATEALEETAPGDEAPEPYLRRVLEGANERIHGIAQKDASTSGMGTTLTAALIRDDEISIAHVGDSRAYLYRDSELKRLTSDHSLVEELRRQGRLTDEQAEEHPQRSIITRALGPEPVVEVDTMTYQARAGDVILLCSDGLTTMISEARMAEILAAAPSLDAAAEQMIEEANANGGRDNITVVAFRLEEEGVEVADSQATLIGPTAEEAGLTADRVAGAGAAAGGRAGARRTAATSAAEAPRRRWPGRVARALVTLLIIGGLGAAAWYGSRQVHFLGVDEAGRVTLYEGLPYDLPFGIELYEEELSTPVQLTSLPPDRRDEATNHELRSEDDAKNLIEDLESAAVAPTAQPPAGGAGTGQGGNQGGKPGGSGSGGDVEARQGRGRQAGRPMSARNRELLALLPVALLVTAGLTAVFIVRSNQIGDLSLTYGAYFLGVCLAVHLVIRLRLPHADPYLFPLVALLAAFGLVVLFRIDEELAVKQASLMLLGLGFFAATVVLLRDYHVLERYRYLIALVGIGLLLLPRIPGIGEQINGAFLGIRIGSVSFQPAEFAKICIVIFLASYLREKREVLIVGARRVAGITLPPLKHLGPLLVVWGAAMLMLVFIRDLGSSLMFFAAFLALIYVATARVSFVLIGMLMFIVGAWFFANTVPHVEERVDIWLDPFKDTQGSGFQVAQSLFAQADGGLFGAGLGESLMQLPGADNQCIRQFPECGSIIPAPHTDLIYAVITNELGLFGAAGVVLIYVLIASRGFKTAVMAPDGFSKLLAAGLTAIFAIQAFVIIGGVVRVIPLTGVTLPFISYGGSSVVANMVLLALLLMISNEARRPDAGDAEPDFALGGARA